jgi:glycosyltransferase involved in cell wall biosynthesis
MVFVKFCAVVEGVCWVSKIILLGPYPPPYGGVAVYIHTLKEFIKRFGFDYEVKIYRERWDLSSDCVRPTFISVYKNFSKVTGNDTCMDSCTFFLEYPSTRATFAWLLIKILKRFRWIKIIHDGTLPTRYKGFGFIEKILFRLSIQCVDEFIVVSEDLLLFLQKRINVKQRVLLIKSLLPLPPNTFEHSVPPEIMKLISQYDKLVSSIGVFTPNYGFEHIANAVEIIRQEFGINIGLLLIDGSFANDESYRSKVLRGRKWVVVLKNVPHAQVLQILMKSDVFVRGAALESYGLSRVEALWAGIPVVATRVGETRGMLLYDFGKEKELVQQIRRALFNPPTEDIKVWGDYFTKEANDNLMTLIRLIDPGRRDICSAE